MKSVFLKLIKNGKSESLAIKTTYLTHYVSYLNLEGKVSSNKISRFIGNLSLNWKWAWKAHLLSHSSLTFENQISLEMFKCYYYHFLKCLQIRALEKSPLAEPCRDSDPWMSKLVLLQLPENENCIKRENPSTFWMVAASTIATF